MPHGALLLPEGPGVDGAAGAGVVAEGVLAAVRLKQEEGIVDMDITEMPTEFLYD